MNYNADSATQLSAFKDHISGFPAGNLSIASPIKIKLRHPITELDSLKELPKGLATISPSVKGQWYVDNMQTIIFQPESFLKADTKYKVKLKLGELKRVGKEQQVFQFEFKTITPNFDVYLDALQAGETADQQVLSGYIRTADVMVTEEIQKVLEARQGRKNLDITWLEPTSTTAFPFEISKIKRDQEKDGEVKVTWNGRRAGVNYQGEQFYSIPSQNTFSVVRMSVVQDPEQHIIVNFSDPLKKTQNFSGLIEIDELEDVRHVVDGNVLRIYPAERTAGDYRVFVNTGVKSETDFNLKTAFSQSVLFESFKPEVRLLGSGAILPSSSQLQFNFEAVNLNKIDVRVIELYQDNILQFLQDNQLEGSSNIRRVGRPIAYKTIELGAGQDASKGWRAYSVDLAEFINGDSGSMYRIEMGFRPEYSNYTCDAIEGLNENDSGSWEEIDEDYWDNTYYYDDYYEYGYYNWRERENPCHAAYYGGNNVVSANILASDIGLLAKQGNNGEVLLATNDLLTGDPMSGVNISIYNFQQQEINKGVTDSKGFYKYSDERRPYFAIASNGRQSTYLKLTDGTALSVSKFDASGAQNEKGLQGYIYGERGVWRPGDSIFLTFVLNDKENPLPDNHPVLFELRDPNGRMLDQQIENLGRDGFYSFHTATTDDAQTGTWSAKIKVGGASFYKNVKVETIKPNRLKIAFDFDDEVVTARSKDPKIEVKWLHGAKAGALRTTVDATLRPKSSPFDNFKDFHFLDPAREFSSEEIRVFDAKLDANGRATIPSGIELEDEAPGMLAATFVTKVSEKGGGFSIDAMTKDYAPYSTFVGVKVPDGDGWGNMLETDKDHEFDVVTVDANGNPKSVSNLSVEVYKVEWRWWWNSSDENLASYIGSSVRKPILSDNISTNSSGKASYKFRINYPEWGRYFVRIKDENGDHATGHIVYVDWPYWRGRGNSDDPEAATMLSFSLDKDNYKVGDDVALTFPSSEKGRALVTVENGSRVLDQFWVKPTKENTKAIFKTTSDMAPNAYVSITYIQPHANTENDMPMRLYGLLPLYVENPKSKINPVIKVADELRPEEDYKVTISEKQGRPMTYTLAIVDEGLLDLTRHKTPNAWDEFFKRQALGVKTWDIYDDVIGAYGGRIDQVFAIGGGDEIENAGAQKANRFIPVVKTLGPFTLNKNKKKTHQITMPNYVGSVRVMVVAGNRKDYAYGNANKAVPVKKPLMVMSAMPRKLSPGEKLRLPVSVFAMDKKVKNVNIDLTTSDGIIISGSSNQKLSFTEEGEKDLYFDLEAGSSTGVEKVDVIASGNGEKSTYSVEIDVVNPNAMSSRYSDVVLGPNESKTLSYERFGEIGSNSNEIQFSILPNMDFTRRLDYLIRYPYGCAEQTTSSAFPQVFLSDIMDISEGKKGEIRTNVIDAINKLGNLQHSNGGIQYWPGASTANDWTTSYVGHFMLEAEKKGYNLPVGFKNKWLAYQKSAAKNWSPSNYTYSSDLSQAYRLYTLALSGNADLSSMNRLRETPRLNNNAKWRLAGAYSLIGQKRLANNLLKDASNDFKPLDRYYSYASDLRNQSMALESAVLLDDKRSRAMAETIATSLADRKWYSTQTVAYSLVALSQFIEKNGGSGLDVSYGQNGVKTTTALALRDLSSGAGNITLKNNKGNTVYVRLHQRGVPSIGTEVSESRGLILQTKFVDMEGNEMTVDRIEQGSDFIAEISVKNDKDRYVNDVALTQIIPSGWEVINTRFTEGGEVSNSDHSDIRDDRVHYFFGLPANETKTFRLHVNASYPGRFYLPGSLAEAMYDNDFYASKSGKWIDIGVAE